jgi:cellulose synthase/poly-beta-1,6-N-acetylglucosamine synthase-like glycosyltransferase
VAAIAGNGIRAIERVIDVAFAAGYAARRWGLPARGLRPVVADERLQHHVLVCTLTVPVASRDARRDAGHGTPSACDVEIIVVDNNSTDDTPSIVAEFSRGSRFPVVSLHERQQGKSFALNLGLAHARATLRADRR